MKTKEELNALKEKVEALTEDELSQVSGGAYNTYYDDITVGTTYTEDNSDGIIRNPGDKYFGDR